MNIAFKRFLRTMTVCMALVCLLGVHASAEGYIIPAEQTPQAAYRYFPNGITSDLVFYFPNALNASFWENLPASIYYDYPDGNLPPDVQEYYRQNIEPVLSGGGRIPGLPPKAYDFYPNGLPDDFLAYFPSAMKEEFWTYFPNSIVMDYGDELPPNAWNYFLRVSPDSLNLGIMPLDDGISPLNNLPYVDTSAEEHHYVKEGESIYFAGTATDESSTAYATISPASQENKDRLAQTGHNRDYSDKLIPLDDCTYTFELASGAAPDFNSEEHIEGNYYIRASKDSSIYLNPPDVGVNNKFNTTTASATRVERIKTQNGFRFAFSKPVTGQSWQYRYIFFEKVNKPGHAYKFDVWPRTPNVTTAEVSLLFDLYEQVTDGSGHKTYVRAEKIEPSLGGNVHKYIIAATIREPNASDTEEHFTYRFVINPSLDFTNVYTQSVKWTDGVNHVVTTGYEVTAGNLPNGTNIYEDAATLTIPVETDIVRDENENPVSIKRTVTTHHIHVVRTPTQSQIAESTAVLSQTGTASGFEVSKISLSLGTSYAVSPSAGYSAAYWVSTDETIATVKDGVITAVGVNPVTNYAKTWVAYVDTKGGIHAIEVVVINQRLSANKKVLDVLLINDNPHADVRTATISNVYVDNDPIKTVYNREVYYFEFDIEEAAGLMFFDKVQTLKVVPANDGSNAGQIPADNDKADHIWFYVNEQEDVEFGTSTDSLTPVSPDEKSVLVNAGFTEANVDKVLTAASAKGFEVFKSCYTPKLTAATEQSDASRNVRGVIRMGVSPILKVQSVNGQPYSMDKTKVYSCRAEETPDSESPNYGDFQSAMSQDLFDRSAWVNINLYENKTRLPGAVVQNALNLDSGTIDVAVNTALLSGTLDTDGLDERYIQYSISSVNGTAVHDWGTFFASEGVVTVPVSAFSPSPFLFTPTDEYYKVTIAWETTDAQIVYRNNYQWNPNELRYERIDAQITGVTPGTAQITVTNESTRAVDYSITFDGRTAGYESTQTAVNDSADAKDGLAAGNSESQSAVYKAEFSAENNHAIPKADYDKTEAVIGTYTVTVGKSGSLG